MIKGVKQTSYSKISNNYGKLNINTENLIESFHAVHGVALRPEIPSLVICTLYIGSSLHWVVHMFMFILQFKIHVVSIKRQTTQYTCTLLNTWQQV